MKIRNLLFVAVIAIVVSCKKERSCNCVITTTGTKTVVSKTAPVVVGFPPFVPTTTITPGSKDSTVTPYNVQSTSVIRYENIRKGTLRQICGSTSTENINTSEQSVTSTNTVSTTDQGVKTTNCSID